MPVLSKSGTCTFFNQNVKMSVEYQLADLLDKNYQIVGKTLKRGRVIGYPCELECGSLENCPIYQSFPKRINQ